MALRTFNSVAGYSIQEIPVTVIDANGNIYANNFTSNNANLGNVGNVTITGGSSGYVLQTDGAGNLTWNATGSPTIIHNGDSNVTIPDSSGNVYINANAGTDYQWNFTTTGNLIAPAIGTANLGNLVTANYANFANDVVVQGNIANANNISVTYDIKSNTANVVGNLTSGNANLGNLVTANTFSTNGSAGNVTLTGGNVLGANVIFSNSITSNGGTVDFNTNNANVQLGNVGNVHIGGGTSGYVLQTDGAGNLTWSPTGSPTIINNGDSNVTIPDANGNVYINANAGTDYQWNFDTTGNLTAPAIGTANLGNLVTANYANFANDVVVQGNIANANNISVTYDIKSNTANVVGNLTAGNINGGNLVTANNFSTNGTAGDLTLTGGNILGANVIFSNSITSNGGTVDFNTNNANVQLGNVGNVHIFGGSNGQVLQTDGAGNLTWSSTANINEIQNGTSNVYIPDTNGNVNTSVNGNANVFVVTGTGANVTGTLDATGNITSLNANLGNLVVANYFSGDGSLLSNINGANVSEVANANYATYSGTADTANSVSGGNITGNITASSGNFFIGDGYGIGNIQGPNIVGNISNVYDVIASNSLQVSTGTGGTISGANLITANYANFANNVFVEGNITANTTLYTNAIASISGNISITPTGTGSSILLVPNGIGVTDAGNALISNLATPLSAYDAATKLYVDNAVSASLVIHPAVAVNVITNQPATYTSGGTSITWTSITSNTNIVTGSAHGLSSGDVIVFASTSNGLTAGTPYFVQYIDTVTIEVSLSLTGAPVMSLVNGTGLSLGSLANSGVGATLESTGTGPLVSNSYTAVLNDRIIVLGQTDQTQNGVYTVTQVGVVSSTPWILTRATDADSYITNSALGLSAGSYFLVSAGSEAGYSYVCATTGVIVFGTTNIEFSQFSQTQVYTAGIGLGLYPNNEFYVANTSVTAGSYGNGDYISTFTVNDRGQLTAAGTVASAANAANLSGTTLATGIVSSSLTSVGTLTGLSVNATVTANTFTSNIATGTAPLIVSSTTLVPNLYVAQSNVSMYSNVTTATTGTYYPQFTNAVTGNTQTYANSNISANIANGALIATTFVGNFSGTLANGTSNVSIPTANGNINQYSNGNLTLTVTDIGANITGYANITGNVSANNATISKVVNLGNSVITSATTTTSAVTANQPIASFSVTGVTGVEFLVKGVDTSGAKYSVATVQAVTDGANVDYVIYGGSFLGSYTGSLTVAINAGNIDLRVTPSSSNSTVWTTQYRLI